MPRSSGGNSQVIQQSSREESLSSVSSQGSPFRRVSAFLVYVGLLVSYSIMGTYFISESFYKFARFGRAIIDGVSVNYSQSLNDMTTADKFWEYINGTLFPSLYAYQLSEAPLADILTYPPIDVLRSSYLVGDILMYNSRVSQDTSCEVKQPFSEYVNKCFPPSEAPDTTSYGSPDPVFEFTFPEEIPISFPTVSGFDMNEGGFFESISSNATVAFKTIDFLKSNTFIDSTSTRAIGVLFTMYNANFQLFQSVQLYFEITPTQLWKPATVILGTFPYWLTPTMFGDNLSSSFIAAFSVTCFFTFASLLNWTISLIVSREKKNFLRSNFGILIILILCIVSLVLLSTLLSLPLGRANESFHAPASERETSPFTFFLNSANFSYNFDIIRTVFGVNLIIIFVQVIVQIGHVFFLPSLRVLGIIGLLIVAFGFADYIAQSTSSVGRSIFNTSLLWLNDWSELAVSSAGRVLLTAVYLFLMFGSFVYLWAGLGHKMLDHRETSETSIDKQVESSLASFRKSCKEYYEYLVFERFNLDSFFKKYFPGFYYRVIIEERLFQQKVEAAITQKSLSRYRRAGFIASERREQKGGTVDLDSAAAQMQIQDQFKVNLETLDDAAATVHGRMVEVDEEMTRELEELSKQVADIEKYITILDRKVNL